MGAPRVVVVANPTAGAGRAGKAIGRADSLLHDVGVEEIAVFERRERRLEPLG